MKKKFRVSTVTQLFMMLDGIFLVLAFFLPLYKNTVTYTDPYFSSENLFSLRPDGAISYMGLAAQFLDNGNAAVFLMILALLLVVPLILILVTFPKLRTFSYFAILPIIGILFCHTFLGLGFTVEQKALEFTTLGLLYSIGAAQLPCLYLLFVIQSPIEAAQRKKEEKANGAAPASVTQQNTAADAQPSAMAQPVMEKNLQAAQNPQASRAAEYSQPMQQPAAPQQRPISEYPKEFTSRPDNNYYGGPELGPQSKEEEAYQQDESFDMESIEPKEKAPEAAEEDIFSEAEVSDESAEDVVAFDNGQEPAADTDSKEVAYCEECGAKLEPGAKFCMQCGAPINR